MFPQVADDMAAARCSFVASANLTDNFPVTSVPGDLIPMLNEAAEPRVREAIRDFAAARGFRRDVFARGPNKISAAEQELVLRGTVFAGLGVRPEGVLPIPCSVGTAHGPAVLYRPLIDAVAGGPRPYGEALAASPLAGRPFAELIEAISMLMAGGYIHPAASANSAAAGRWRRIAPASWRTTSPQPVMTRPGGGTCCAKRCCWTARRASTIRPRPPSRRCARGSAPPCRSGQSCCWSTASRNTCARAARGTGFWCRANGIPPSSAFVWSRAPISTLLFCVAGGPVEWLRIGLLFDRSPMHERRFRIVLNHNLIWMGTITEASSGELMLAATGRSVSHDAPNLLQFEVDEPFVPSAQSLSSDNRTLGVGLKRIWVQRGAGVA